MLPKEIQNIKHVIKTQLPGLDAQKLMAPSMRNPHFELMQPTSKSQKAAVLLLLFYENKKLNIFFIKRATYNGHHSGQISFPGGKKDKTDKNLYITALRECEEEIGIDSSKVKILGQITPLHIPISDITVFPVAGYLPVKPETKAEISEVVEIIQMEIEALMAPENQLTEVIQTNGFEITAPYYLAKGNHIWGATAMILSEFLEIIKLSQKL